MSYYFASTLFPIVQFKITSPVQYSLGQLNKDFYFLDLLPIFKQASSFISNQGL